LKKLTWRDLNHILATKTEEEVLQMLNEEQVTGRRVVVLKRLHQRYNVLRVSRERVELLNGARRA
jgi:predicted lipoprotein